MTLAVLNATLQHPLPEFPSPLWGGVRGGGKPYLGCSAIPPSLSLPHKGGGDHPTPKSHHAA
jgi:hypothetical protein